MRDGGDLLEAWRRIFERRRKHRGTERALARAAGRGRACGNKPDEFVKPVYWRWFTLLGMLRKRR